MARGLTLDARDNTKVLISWTHAFIAATRATQTKSLSSLKLQVLGQCKIILWAGKVALQYMSPSYINCVARTETDIPRWDTRSGLIGHIFIGERKSESFLFPFLNIL